MTDTYDATVVNGIEERREAMVKNAIARLWDGIKSDEFNPYFNPDLYTVEACRWYDCGRVEIDTVDLLDVESRLCIEVRHYYDDWGVSQFEVNCQHSARDISDLRYILDAIPELVRRLSDTAQELTFIYSDEFADDL